MRNKKRNKKPVVKKGSEVYVNGVVHVVAEVLSKQGENTSIATEIDKPSITVHRVKGSTTLKRSAIFVNTDYSIRPNLI